MLKKDYILPQLHASVTLQKFLFPNTDIYTNRYFEYIFFKIVCHISHHLYFFLNCTTPGFCKKKKITCNRITNKDIDVDE